MSIIAKQIIQNKIDYFKSLANTPFPLTTSDMTQVIESLLYQMYSDGLIPLSHIEKYLNEIFPNNGGSSYGAN